MLIAAMANLNQATNKGCTPLYAACQRGHTEVVTKLLAANADVEQGLQAGHHAALHRLYERPHRDRREADRRGASVHRADNRGFTPMVMACTAAASASSSSSPRTAPAAPSSTGRSTRWSTSPPITATPTSPPGAARPASGRRRSTTSSSSRPSARALLRAGDNIHAAAAPGGPTPLSIARALAAAGGAAEGTAAFLVLEAAKPWSRKMHKIFPPAARGRVADLMRIAQAIKRGKAA